MARGWPLVLLYLLFAVALYFAAREWKRQQAPVHRPLDWIDFEDRLI